MSPGPGRAFLRTLRARCLLLSCEGALAMAGTLLAGPLLSRAGVWKNFSRSCWVLEAMGVQATVPRAATPEAGLV